ncbi:unnamed protein product [Mytilus coruscus]|uniref:Uncharacterized protein n=1 Tax=Mytilus coruscus TaxID=42192 RepID=A0A6J8E5X0_MYTCO|nr:unnamed protein product [Mytilus coruscus]
MAMEFLKHKYLTAFDEYFSMDYKKKSYPIKPGPPPHTHLRPCQSSCIQREGKRKFLVSSHLGKVELLPSGTEACDLESFSAIPANQSLTRLDDVKVVYSIENLDKRIVYEKENDDTATKLENKTTESADNKWWPNGDSNDMWRATKSRRQVVIRRRKRPKRACPNTPRQSDDKKQRDHANAKELSNGNNLSSIDIGSAINKKLLAETLKKCVLKKSVSMESVFEGDGTKVRYSFTWRMGDEYVSLEKLHDQQLDCEHPMNRNLISGAWRQGPNLQDTQNVTTANIDRKRGKMQMNLIKHWINSPAGSVAWQDRMI